MSHAKIAELLPWYVNGTLGMGERQAAALEVASCDACAAEVDGLSKIQTAILELEATAPEPDEHGLARALDAVEREEERKRLGHPWFGWWWTLTPFGRVLVVSGVLGAVVAFGIFVSPKPALAPAGGALSGDSTPIALEHLTGATSTLRAAETPAHAGGSPALSARASSGVQPSLQDADAVARTADMSIIVPDVERAVARVSATARADGGIVLSLDDETPTQPGARRSARIEIGVPDLRFEPALDALGRIGGVQSRSVGAQDVASQIVDGQARLRNLRSTEHDLLKIMARAGTIADVLAVESQVSTTREQIERLDADVQALKHEVAMSTISVDLEGEMPAPAAALGMRAQLASTWAAAVDSMKAFTLAIVGALLWLIAYGPYVLGVALAGGIVAATRKRY